MPLCLLETPNTPKILKSLLKYLKILISRTKILSLDILHKLKVDGRKEG